MRMFVTGVEEVRSRLKWLRSAMEKTGSDSVQEALLAGKNFAKSIAPIDTGAMIKAIHFTAKAGKDKNIGILSADQPNNSNNLKNFPYHVFMHLNPRAKNWRGDPQFMFTTADFLNTEFPAKVRNKVMTAVKMVQ